MFISVVSSVSRFYEVVAGLLLGLFGLLCAALVILATIRTLQRGTFDLVVAAIVGVLLALASGCGVTAFRLISGRGRDSDGGLFPPWILRILGIVFFAACVWFSVQGDIPVTHIERIVVTVMAPMLGLGCFYLANRQRRAAQGIHIAGNDT